MQILTKLLGVLLGLALLAGLGLAGFVALEWLMRVFLSLDPRSTMLTGIASVVCLAVALVLADRARRAGGRGGRDAMADHRSDAYALFLDAWGGRLPTDRCPAVRRQEDLPDDLDSLDRQLILFGSASVLKAHMVLRAAERQGGLASPDGRKQFIEALILIRKEQGQDIAGIDRAELARLFFPDWDATDHPAGRPPAPKPVPEPHGPAGETP